MLKNYLKIAGRNLRKQKGFAFINIFSLSVGMVCCLLILLFVQFERSYDNFHEHRARVYRIPMQKKSASREVAWAVNTAPLAPALKEHFSQVEAAGRLAYQNSVLVQYGDQTSIENNVAWGDQAIFDILTIAFLDGNSSTALSRPHTAVITRATAARFFGSTPSIGKSLIIDGEEYEITGVIENVPEHSHLTFNIIASLLFQEEPWWMTHWPTATCYTYVKLATGVDVANFERQLSTIGDTFSDQYRQRGEHVTFSKQELSAA